MGRSHDGPFLETRLRFDPMRFSSAERRGEGRGGRRLVRSAVRTGPRPSQMGATSNYSHTMNFCGSCPKGGHDFYSLLATFDGVFDGASAWPVNSSLVPARLTGRSSGGVKPRRGPLGDTRDH